MLEFFSPQLGNYENFTFNEGSFVSFKVIIAGIYFGVILACLCALYNRRVLGAFVRAIIKREAFSKEKALTLDELGYSKNIFVKYSLIYGNTLKNSISCVEYENFKESIKSESTDEKSAKKALISAKFKPDAKTARFYIPEDKKYRMEYKFEAKGTNWLTFVFTLIAITAITILVVRYLPEMLSFLDSFL